MGAITQLALKVQSDFRGKGFPQLTKLLETLIDQAIAGTAVREIIEIRDESGELLIVLGDSETGTDPLEAIIRAAPNWDETRFAQLNSGTIVSVKLSQVPVRRA